MGSIPHSRSQTRNPPAPEPAAEAGQPSVYARLRQMILDNELKPGRFVLQEELGEMLGVSRTPIREALIRLEQEGLVEVRPRHGMQVQPVSADDMRDIYVLLTALEALAARLVAEQGLASHRLVMLDRSVADMEQALAADDLDRWAEADDRFHRLLVAFSGNQRLISMIETVADQAYRVRRITLRLRPKPVSSNADHRALVDALRARDGARAYQIHHEHRERSGRLLVELIERMEAKTV